MIEIALLFEILILIGRGAELFEIYEQEGLSPKFCMASKGHLPIRGGDSSPPVPTKGLSRSARRFFRRIILSLKVFRSVKIQKNTQFTLYNNATYRFRRTKVYAFETRGVARVRHMGPRPQPQRLCPLEFHKLALGAATLSRNCRTLKIGLATPLFESRSVSLDGCIIPCSARLC